MRELRVAIVTASQLPEPDLDEPVLLDALARRSVLADVVAWDDPAVAWGAFDLAVVRSTWNYYRDRPAFCAWATRAARATRVLNGPDLLCWNTDKRYLCELRDRGFPVVPTLLVEQGDAVSLGLLALERAWSSVVLKPRVSAGSFGTRRFELPAEGQEAARFLAASLADRAMMVQPYLPSVETSGERAIVSIDGVLTHAVRKAPRFAGAEEQVSPAVPVAPDEQSLAERLLEPFGNRLLYGRVDVARDANGNVLLMELEIAEPSLFLAACPAALERFATAIARRAAEPPASRSGAGGG